MNEQLLEAKPHAKSQRQKAGHLRTTPLCSEAIVGAVDAEIGFPTGTQKRPPSTTDRQTHVFLVFQRPQTARKTWNKTKGKNDLMEKSLSHEKSEKQLLPCLPIPPPSWPTSVHPTRQFPRILALQVLYSTYAGTSPSLNKREQAGPRVPDSRKAWEKPRAAKAHACSSRVESCLVPSRIRLGPNPGTL